MILVAVLKSMINIISEIRLIFMTDFVKLSEFLFFLFKMIQLNQYRVQRQWTSLYTYQSAQGLDKLMYGIYIENNQQARYMNRGMDL